MRAALSVSSLYAQPIGYAGTCTDKFTIEKVILSNPANPSSSSNNKQLPPFKRVPMGLMTTPRMASAELRRATAQQPRKHTARSSRTLPMSTLPALKVGQRFFSFPMASFFSSPLQSLFPYTFDLGATYHYSGSAVGLVVVCATDRLCGRSVLLHLRFKI